MSSEEHDAMLKSLGVNLEPICATSKNGRLCNYHKAGDTTILIVPATSLSEDQRRAQIEEIRNFLDQD